jgi:hypothetical protein
MAPKPTTKMNENSATRFTVEYLTSILTVPMPLTVDMPLNKYMQSLSTIKNIPDMINHMGNFEARRCYPTASGLSSYIRAENFIPSDIDINLMLSGHLSCVVDNDKAPEHLLKWINGAKRYTELLRSEFETLFIQSQTELKKRISFIERHVVKKREEGRRIKNAMREPGSLSNRVLQLPDELIRLIGSYVYMPTVRLSVLQSTQSVLLGQVGKMGVARYVKLMDSVKKHITNFVIHYHMKTHDLYPLISVQYKQKSLTKSLPQYIREVGSKAKSRVIQNKETRVQYIKDVFDTYQYLIGVAQNMKLKNVEQKTIDRLLHLYHTVNYCSHPRFNVRKKPVRNAATTETATTTTTTA